MSALNKKEIELIGGYALKYSIPVVYDLGNYSSTSRRFKSGKRGPDWIINSLRTLDKPVDGDYGVNNDIYSSIIWIMTGNWGIVSIAVLKIDIYDKQINKFYKLATKKLKLMEAGEEKNIVKNCLKFTRDYLNSRLPVLTKQELIPPPEPKRNMKFPKYSTAGDLGETMALYNLGKTCDGKNFVNYLNQDILFETMALSGIIANPNSTKNVLDKVVEILENGRMDYTNTPEKDYYRNVNSMLVEVNDRLNRL